MIELGAQEDPMNDIRAEAGMSRCLTCNGSLPADHHHRCALCIRAATIAIEEADGRTVGPSDVDAVRRCLEQAAEA